MFEAFTTVVLLLPTALFGRRRGGDRHGEVPGTPAADGAGDEAFTAFEDFVLHDGGGVPDGLVVDVAFAPADLDEAAAVAAVVEAPVEAPVDVPFDGEAPEVGFSTDTISSVDEALDHEAVNHEAVDHEAVDQGIVQAVGDGVEEERPTGDRSPVQASRDAAVGASVVDPSLVDAPGWVVGETSLDSHPDAIDHASGVPAEELWHPAPGDVARLEAPVPFEERLGVPMPTSDVWGPAAVEPVSVASGSMGAAPFRLNRLKRVAGPTDSDAAGSVVVARDGGIPGEGASLGGAHDGNGHDGKGYDGNGSASTGGRLISGPVGRSRARTEARHVRRPLPIGSLASGAGRGLGAADARADRGLAGRSVDGRPGGRDLGERPHEPSGTAPSAVEPTDSDRAGRAPDDDVPVFVSADGTVAIGAGSVRVARPEDASASSGPDGLVVQLTDHWCWAALDELGPDLTVRAGSTVLHVPAGTTALLSIDDDSSQLVVVLDGEAVVDHDGTRIQLRTGAMAYLTVDGDPQVDVAEDDEIRADPLVARNLRLDQV